MIPKRVRFSRRQLETISTVFSELAGECQADAFNEKPTKGIDAALHHFHKIASKAAGAFGYEAWKVHTKEQVVLEKSRKQLNKKRKLERKPL